jgi:hypothetical protein
VAIELIKAEGIDGTINMGQYGLLDEIYGQCKERGLTTTTLHHPLDRQSYVMAQLRKSRQFKNVGYISYPGFKGYAKCAVLEIRGWQQDQ